MPEWVSVQARSSGSRTSSYTACVGYSLPSASLTITVLNTPPGRASTSMRSRGADTPAGPQKCARWSGSIMQRNTSSRGAANTRLKRSWLGGPPVLRPSPLTLPSRGLVWTLVSPSGTPRLRRRRALQVGEQRVELVEALAPEAPVGGDPVERAVERLGLEVARPELGVASPRDQAAALEDLEVLGDPRQRHGEGGGQVADRRVAPRQAAEDGAPGRVRQGGEGRIEPVVRGGGHPPYLTKELVSCQVNYGSGCSAPARRLPAALVRRVPARG